MHLDVQDLRNFYYRSSLGRAAKVIVLDEILNFWPEAKGQTVVGYGFAVPFLRPFLKDARRLMALMPAPQGVIGWPQEMPNVSVLCEETYWPIETGHVDKLLVVHGLETSEQPGALLEECWRVLGPGGSALFIVPNRAGLWSRSDSTPFGFGRPYTQSQLENQLKTHHFLPERHVTTLFQPPSERRFWRKTARMWESLGGRISFGVAGGVLIVEASKRVHAASGTGLRETVRKPLEVLQPKPVRPLVQSTGTMSQAKSARLSSLTASER
jgi:SAM-dependent methyltransferase